MGGRGSHSGLKFAVPQNKGSFQQTAMMEEPPKTLKQALGAKGPEKSIKDSYQDANPYFSRNYAEYSENCQRCVVAYELRRRGYDVIAQATHENDKWPTSVLVNGVPMGRWRGAFRHAKTDSVGAAGNNAKAEAKVLNNISNTMKGYGNGSRAIIRIGYRGAHVGHVFNAENQNGRMVYVDAQTGTRYTHADMRNLMKVVDTSSVTVTRTDNLRISNRAKEFVWQRHRNK